MLTSASVSETTDEAVVLIEMSGEVIGEEENVEIPRKIKTNGAPIIAYKQ